MPHQEKTIELADMPELITNYLKAHKARDLDAALGSYSPDPTVTDEGRNYQGLDEIRAWLSRSASQYTYTIEMIGATEIDQDHYDVTQRLEGDFPGGQVDLHFRFGLRDGAICRLVIAP
jgi:hypothetical protein